MCGTVGVVVCPKHDGSLPISRLYKPTCGIKERQSQPGIDAVEPQPPIGEIENVHKCLPAERVRDGDDIAANVVHGACSMQFNRICRSISVPLRLLNRPTK